MSNKSIQSMGGTARDKALSDEQKTEIARKAALARWGGKLAQATHKGSFKEEFGSDVECYVLDDAQKTAVISQSGMGRAIGLANRGNAFPRFLSSRAISGAVGAELRQKLMQPVKFQWGSGGAEQPPTVVNGFDATLLIDVCRAIIEAESKLTGRQKHIAIQARVILNASAKNGIRGLVYALAGYNPTAQEVIAAFKAYVQEEARKYEKEFPNELYIQWHRLYKIPVPVRGKPWNFKHLTVKHIYYPLAKSNGKILQLVRILKASDGSRNKKLFQFLNELGARALRIQLGRVLEMAESSNNSMAYERKIAERFGGQQELGLEVPPLP
jgi:P63C domain